MTAASRSSIPETPLRREGLSYADEAAVVADVSLLRQGYTAAGNWSLPQACWHLKTVFRVMMAPVADAAAPDSPQGKTRLEQVLTTGKIPGQVQAPDRVLPPVKCEDCEIDEFLETFHRYMNFAGTFPAHRIFGAITLEQGKQLALIHAAHHFSFLIPTPSTAN